MPRLLTKPRSIRLIVVVCRELAFEPTQLVVLKGTFRNPHTGSHLLGGQQSSS